MRMLLAMVVLGVALSSCGVKVPADRDKDGWIDEQDVRAILARLFPDLTAEEIDELVAKLDLETVLKLKAEIEAIRSVSGGLSQALRDLAEQQMQKREKALEAHNGGYPFGLEPLGRAAFYDATRGEGRIDLSGVFTSQTKVQLTSAEISVTVGGVEQSPTLECAHDATPVDIVFLVDVTGSMSPVIGALRRSLVRFVEAIVAANVRGTLSVVSFQDTVGVNVSFQEIAPAGV
jgi:hypothetical protein